MGWKSLLSMLDMIRELRDRETGSTVASISRAHTYHTRGRHWRERSSRGSSDWNPGMVYRGDPTAAVRAYQGIAGLVGLLVGQGLNIE